MKYYLWNTQKMLIVQLLHISFKCFQMVEMNLFKDVKHRAKYNIFKTNVSTTVLNRKGNHYAGASVS